VKRGDELKTTQQNYSLFNWLRDKAYDGVFHVGDTALQFTADIIRGSDHSRHDSYATRQMNRVERKQAPKPKQVKPEKPLNFQEKAFFVEMMRRKENESVIDHWKRRKELLAHPQKRNLIQIEQKLNAEQTKQHAIKTEMKPIATTYQKERVQKQKRERTRKRSR